MPANKLPYQGPFHDISDEQMITINDRGEIPHFASEEEEATFWDTHTLADHLWRKERGPRPGTLAERLSKQRFMPRAVFSKEADAVYVYLAWGRTARTNVLDGSRSVTYDAGGNVIGAQFSNVSHGIDLRGLPEPQRFGDLVKDLNLHILA